MTTSKLKLEIHRIALLWFWRVII